MRENFWVENVGEVPEGVSWDTPIMFLHTDGEVEIFTPTKQTPSNDPFLWEIPDYPDNWEELEKYDWLYSDEHGSVRNHATHWAYFPNKKAINNVKGVLP